MKTTLMILMIAMLALSACAPVAQQPAAAPMPAQESTTPEMIVEEAAPSVDYSIQEATRAKVTSNMKATTKYYLSESYKQLALGQHHTFAMGFTNRLEKKDNFLVNIKFIKAYDKSSNSLEVTEEQVNPWIANNDFAILPLDINQQTIQPVVIEVANFADGSSPKKGSYQFEVTVLYQNGLFSPTTEYSGRLPVIVQVI